MTTPSTSGGPVQPPPPAKYAKSAVDAIVEAYYPREVAAVDTARGRAQSAYAIASTLAAVLVGAGLLTTLQERPALVRVIGLLALIAWLVAAGLYLRAVASPIDGPAQGPKKGAGAFVDTVLAQARADHQEVDRRLKLANAASIVALGLTVLTVGLGLFITADEPTVTGTVVLNEAGSEAVAEICPTEPSELTGEIEEDSIGADSLHVELPAKECDQTRVELDLPRSGIAAVRSDG